MKIPLEKIHIILNLVDQLCHEMAYHKHTEINYEIMKDEVKRLSQRLTPYKRPININVLKQALPRTKKATVQRNKVKELIQA